MIRYFYQLFLKDLLLGVLSIITITLLAFLLININSLNLSYNFAIFTFKLFSFKIFLASETSIFGLYFNNSMKVILPSFGISLILGFIIGIISGYFYKSKITQYSNLIIYIFSALPVFVIAPILVVFAEQIDLPSIYVETQIANSYVSFLSLIIPNLLIIVICASVFAIFVRNSVIVELSNEYNKFLKAQGFGKVEIYFKSVFKNTFISFLPATLIIFTTILSFDLIVERIFQIPGTSVILMSALKNNGNLFFIYLIAMSLLILLLQLIIEVILKIINPFERVFLVKASKARLDFEIYLSKGVSNAS